MKYIWEEKDIEAGAYFIRGLPDKEDSPAVAWPKIQSAFRHFYKIGYLHMFSDDLDVQDPSEVFGKFVHISMTDGCVMSCGKDVSDLVQYLNEEGFQPLSPREVSEFMAKYWRMKAHISS